MIDISISEAAELLRRKKISPVDLATACLDRIERLNPVLNAFITVTHEGAMAQARVAEDEIQRGQWRGPLHGIPIGLKDLIDTAGAVTQKTTNKSARIVLVLVKKMNRAELRFCDMTGSSLVFAEQIRFALRRLAD